MGIKQSGTRADPRADLGAAFMEYVDQQSLLIGLKVAPILKVQEKKASFAAITRECLTRDVETARKANGKYNREGIETEDINYDCQEHGLEGALDDGQRKLYASDFDAELVTTQQIANLLLLGQEKRWAAALFNTTTFTGGSLYTDISSSAPFDAVGSDVIGAIKTGREKVRQNCGIEPTDLIISKTNLDRLTANTAVKAAIQYVARLTEAEIINALADILGVKRILVGKAVRNTANKGKTFVGADVWNDDYAMLAVVAPDGQNFVQPGIAKTVLWSLDSPDNVMVESYRDEGIRSDVFRVRNQVDEKIIDPSFGHLLKVDA